MAVDMPRAVKSVGDRRRMCRCAAMLGAMFLTNVSVSSVAYCAQLTTQTTTKAQTQQDTEAHVLEESVRADAQVLDATTKANAQTLEAIEKSNAQSIDAVTKTSIATYAAAKDVLEHTEWVVSIASLIVAGVVSLAAFFGFRNINGITASIRREAIKQTNEEMAIVSKNMRQVMKFSIRAQAAVRQAVVAEQWSDVESKRLEAFDSAIVAIKEARSAIQSLGTEFDDKRTISWTYSFEAYCLRALGRYSEAIAQQLIALQSSEVEDPLDRYNLACMHALAGHVEQAHNALRSAIDRDPQYRMEATKDPDFRVLREQGLIADLIGSGWQQNAPKKSSVPGHVNQGPPAPGTDDASGRPEGQPS